MLRAAAKIAGHILAEVAFKHLLYGYRAAVATITINRPDDRNSLSTETVGELRDALAQAKGDAQVRVIVLTGAGKVFCAGADLNSFRREQPELERHVQRRQLAELFLEMTELGKPTVARINGHALAGGFGLVASCDLAIAVDEAQFGMPEVNVGIFPMLIMAIVFRNLPRKAAMDLMLTGKRIDAAEATRLGLINRHVPAERLDAEVDALADELAKKSPIGMKLGLEAFYKVQDMSFPSAIAYLQDRLALLSLSDDLKEGVTAFFEKREPRFTGR
ncbi:MAG: enoyl-CoA hydratase [Chloroflexota bacterium]|nr:enoyl-CoA hydratase [Chloroflexota bacterium]